MSAVSAAAGVAADAGAVERIADVVALGAGVVAGVRTATAGVVTAASAGSGIA